MSPLTPRSGAAPTSRRTPPGEVEQQVLEAVEALLAEGASFTALGVGRIADRAGVARSSFYVNFPDKTALLLQVTESATSVLFTTAEAWVEDLEHDLPGLEATLAALVTEYRRHGPLLAAVAEVATYEPTIAAYWRTRVLAFAELLERRLTRDRAAGLLEADLDAATTAAWLAWGVERMVSQAVAEDASGAGDARLVRGLARGMWSVMAPRTA